MISIVQGDTFSVGLVLEVTVNDSPTPDLTGWTGVARMQRRNGTVVQVLAFAWINAAARSCALAATAAQTASWPVAILELHLALTGPGGAPVLSLAPVAITVRRGMTA